MVVREERADEALMEAYQRGDTRAFEVLLNRHQRPVYNFLARQVGNPALAEDLLQDVFLRVIKGARFHSGDGIAAQDKILALQI